MLINTCRYLTDTYQYLTNIMIIPYLTDFLIQINFYQYLAVTCQNLINTYIIVAIFNRP